MLLLLPFALLYAQTKTPLDADPFSRFLTTATAPLQSFITSVIGALAGAWYHYVDLTEARVEADQLRKERDQLRLESHQLREQELENERLRRLLEFRDANPEIPMAGAKVIGQGLSSQFRTIRINLGERDGVARDMPVMAGQGLVGRVRVAHPTTSEVQLIVDPRSAWPVRLQQGRGHGIVVGTGDFETCRVDYVSVNYPVRKGDIFVTAAAGELVPAGLPLGKVTRVEKQGAQPYYSIELVPLADIARVEEVMVLKTAPARK
ncbi:MAG: hypothetical protein GMKNLPBB_02963 [Myxococcota bacterium]|nr:hypothetical protein [Myxococcota bacterium]